MLQWYVARVKPNIERAVKARLGQNGVEVYTPEILVMKRGKSAREPLFPGYVLVLTDPSCEKWPMIKWARGLKYFLPDKMEPMPVPESVIAQIAARVERWNDGGWIAAFQPGDHVAIQGGPLRTLDAIFHRYIPGKERCEVLVQLMGRPQRVKVNLTDMDSVVARQRFALP